MRRRRRGKGRETLRRRSKEEGKRGGGVEGVGGGMTMRQQGRGGAGR